MVDHYTCQLVQEYIRKGILYPQGSHEIINNTSEQVQPIKDRTRSYTVEED
jgi:hypothetical protein